MTRYMTPLTTRMERELHKRLKAAALREDTTLSALLERFARAGLRRLEDGDWRRGDADIETYEKDAA